MSRDTRDGASASIAQTESIEACVVGKQTTFDIAKKRPAPLFGGNQDPSSLP